MSVEFRQRTPAEYLQMIRRRKWMIILPIIAVTTAVSWVVYRLPDVYESSTLIVVTPATLPNSVVPTITEDSLTRQLTSIAQVVTSRSSLEPLVEKYELYKPERARGEAMETVVQKVRDDIKVEVNTSRNDITNGFNIRFRGRDPRTTQAVTRDLASKYIDEQNTVQLNNLTSGRAFFAQQVRQAKEELDALDTKRLEFMQSNVGNLPSEGTALLNQLSGLREQQKALISETGRLQDRRSAAANQLALIKQRNINVIDDLSENTTDPKTTSAWGQLASRKAALEGEYTRLVQELKPKHPDVIAKKAEIEQVQKQMDDMIGEWKDKIAERKKKLSSQPDLQVSAIEADLKLVDNEIKRQQKLLDENERAINQILGRLNLVPSAEVQLAGIEREYQTKKLAYDQLLDQESKIALMGEAAKEQQGGGIRVIDPANLPATPVAPKRLALAALGLAVGLGIGVLLAAAFEVPRLLTIQSSEDARHYTGLPVLISVPELLTPQEARAIPRRRRLLFAAGVAATIVSIPVLALALKLTHIFEILSQSRAS